jgi:hypothetical protein
VGERGKGRRNKEEEKTEEAQEQRWGMCAFVASRAATKRGPDKPSGLEFSGVRNTREKSMTARSNAAVVSLERTAWVVPHPKQAHRPSLV